MELTKWADGTELTRGQYGDRIGTLYRLVWDCGEWRPASQTDKPSQTEWGVWDSNYGWLPYFT